MLSPDRSMMYLHRPKTAGSTVSEVLGRAGWVSHAPSHMDIDTAHRVAPHARVVVTTRPESEWLDSWYRHCMRAVDEGRAIGAPNVRTEASLRWYGNGSLEREDVLRGARNVWECYARRGAHPIRREQGDHLLRPWHGEAPPCMTLDSCARYLWEWGADVLLPVDEIDERGDEVFGLEPGSFAKVGRLNVGRVA